MVGKKQKKENIMKTKLLALLLVIIMAVGMLAACGGGKKDPCTNHVDTDGDGLCDNDGCDEPVKTACTTHTDANKDGLCDNCGATVGVAGCDNHADNDGDGKCDNCGAYYDVWDEITVEWDTTDIIFSLSENSNGDELPSTCKRYMAGEDTDKNGQAYKETIDTYVTNRNTAAYAKTKVNVIYDYTYTDDSKYGWGQCIEQILTKVKSGDDDAPDIYCNFVYDMVSISLKGGFANLYSKSRLSDGTETTGINYFQFAGDYDTYKDSGNGYMIEYMKSLTLSKTKMYCLSSDYFIDMVRGFFVVPVNVYLMNSIEMSPNAGDFNSDRNGDGKFSIDDFYQLVWDGEWDYETVAEFSAKVTQQVGSDPAVTNLEDIVGFAVSAGGLSASGMLYTTSITIINRDWSDAENDYVYSYPDPNTEKGQADIADLVKLCENMNTLFGKTGVIAVSNGDPDVGMYSEDGTSLSAIRNRFAENTVLFGGVICLGSLELEEYQEMKSGGVNSGFGIAPAPLYRTKEAAIAATGEADKYLTAIHNVARVGGISANTTKFAQCSAFLDYVSTKRTDSSTVKDSTDILDYYYNIKLQYDISDGSSGNTEMLQYIRYNVRSSFDKAYEDAIGRFFSNVDANSIKNLWHEMLSNSQYQITDMNARYNSIYSSKANYLKSLWNEYPILPD